MIPIRRYPYTDFHDLNLDYLLRQIAEFEEDLEALKRRVTALEAWQIIIDGDITTIKGDIVDIKGDIVDIKGDIVDIKGDIVDIKGDIVDINTTLGDHTTKIRDLTYDNRMFKSHLFSFELRLPPASDPAYEDISEGDYTKKLKCDIASPIINPNYSDMLAIDAFIDEDTEVRIHFKSFEDFETYSDIICEYVETEDPDADPGESAGSLGYITLKFKEIPSDIGLLELMVYCRGFYIGTPWND